MEKERLNGITESIIGAAIDHQAQGLSYLRLSGCKVGLLINFNVKVLKECIRRVVNDFPDSPCKPFQGLRGRGAELHTLRAPR
ncbi:MAG: hypothetical protein EFT35_07485 [Methanophagales archaeon ANME-1-THS]|nr:MAG: hypothetical protein EFT35_07485 [Methanophagales archaeon ANME-1-THS]